MSVKKYFFVNHTLRRDDLRATAKKSQNAKYIATA